MENTVTLASEHETAVSHPEARTLSITTSTRYQTSDDPLNVGSAADVFIGVSNNIYYGAVDYIDILDKEAFDQSWKGEDGTVEDYTQATGLTEQPIIYVGGKC